MTTGHKHHIIHIKHNGLLYRILTEPTLNTTTHEKAGKSRFAYGPTTNPDVWKLSPLGFLHTLTGLTVVATTED